MEASRRLERLVLYHLWACVPFAVAWAIWPGVLGVSQEPQEILALRLVIGVAGLYLVARSWIVLSSPAAATWRFVWPIADVILISAALLVESRPGGGTKITFTVPMAPPPGGPGIDESAPASTA